MRLPLLVVGALALSGCTGVDDPIVCTSDLRWGITVTVVDSMSGQAITPAAQVIAREGAFADTARPFFPPVYTLVPDRTGTYDLTVEQAGYRAWSRSGVQVTANRCHVNPVSLTAKLQR